MTTAPSIKVLLWEFCGDARKAARYCRSVAAQRGSLAAEYADAAVILEACADDLDRKKQG